MVSVAQLDEYTNDRADGEDGEDGEGGEVELPLAPFGQSCAAGLGLVRLVANCQQNCWQIFPHVICHQPCVQDALSCIGASRSGYAALTSSCRAIFVAECIS